MAKKSIKNSNSKIIEFIMIGIIISGALVSGLFYNKNIPIKNGLSNLVTKIVEPVYVQYEIGKMESFNYKEWYRYTYPSGDFSFMVPNSHRITVNKPSEGSPCKSSVNIGVNNGQNIAEIQVNKCPTESGSDYASFALFGNDGVISDLELDGITGKMRQGKRGVEGGKGFVMAQEFVFYKDKFKYSIFRILDDLTITDEQFSQILSSFKFAK